MDARPFLLALAAQRENDTGRVGRLGTELGDLARRGLPVADGFVVTAQAYLHAMDCAGALGVLRAGRAGLRDAGPLQLASASTKLQDVVRAAGMPDDMREAIRAACKSLRSVRLLVRASEIEPGAGDTRGASFANVVADQACEAVIRCWSSRFSQEALRAQLDGAPDRAIAVVVQRMIECEKAGLMCTADPSTGDSTFAVIGGADTDSAVLGARVDRNTYVVDKRARRMVARACPRSSGTYLDSEERDSEVLPHERTTRVLDDADLASLADLARKLDELYGKPRTIEWALSRQLFYVMRSVAG
jgi:pyruvate,water dikinase